MTSYFISIMACLGVLFTLEKIADGLQKLGVSTNASYLVLICVSGSIALFLAYFS